MEFIWLSLPKFRNMKGVCDFLGRGEFKAIGGFRDFLYDLEGSFA